MHDEPVYENGKLVAGSHVCETPWGPIRVTRSDKTKCEKCGAEQVILMDGHCLQCRKDDGTILGVGFGRTLAGAVEDAIT